MTSRSCRSLVQVLLRWTSCRASGRKALSVRCRKGPKGMRNLHSVLQRALQKDAVLGSYVRHGDKYYEARPALQGKSNTGSSADFEGAESSLTESCAEHVQLGVFISRSPLWQAKEYEFKDYMHIYSWILGSDAEAEAGARFGSFSAGWLQVERRCPDSSRMLAPFKKQLPRLRAAQRRQCALGPVPGWRGCMDPVAAKIRCLFFWPIHSPKFAGFGTNSDAGCISVRTTQLCWRLLLWSFTVVRLPRLLHVGSLS